MTGTEEYNNKFYQKAQAKIAKYPKEWMLNGFYNSIIINKAYTTGCTYLAYVIKFIEQLECEIKDITVDDYYGFMASLKTSSASAQITAYHALQKYSRYLKSKNICEDYMQYVERPKFFETQKTKEKRENGYLTKKETKEMFNQINHGFSKKPRNRNDRWKQREKVIVMIFLNTGIRCAALNKLDIDDVDLDNNTITVFEKGFKTKKIIISDQLVSEIKKWLEYRNDYLDGDTSERALIINHYKKRLDNIGIYNVIKKAGINIKNKNVSPHKLRATYGTQLYNKTHDLYFVQEAMGHSNPKTTETYIRGQKNDVAKKASDLMDDFLS